MASGEMSEAEFLAFNRAWMAAALPFLGDGFNRRAVRTLIGALAGC